MLPANHTVLMNEIRKKQGRPIFALCRACGLAPADGANAKFYLLKHGYIIENSSNGGLYLVNKNPEPVKPARVLQPAENPYRVVRRNEPGQTHAAETTGVLTSEAKLQRKLAETLETPREEPVYQMAKPEPIVEKSVTEQIAEELRWLEQWEREQAELDAEIEAEESDDDIEGTEDEPETDEDADTPDEEPEPEEEEMANLNPIALETLQKARVSLGVEQPKEEQETATVETKPATVYGSTIPVPLTPGGKPMVNDDMILEYLTNHGPATMAKITEFFGRKGSGLATKLSKMVRRKLISERDRIPGQLVVYMTNAAYLREVSGSMPKQILPSHSQVNVERGSMLATREQSVVLPVSKSAIEIKPGQALVLTDDGVKPMSQVYVGDGVAKVVETAPVEPTLKVKAETFPAPVEIKASVTITQYDIMTPEEQQTYLRSEILRHLESGNKDVIMLAMDMPDIPAKDIHITCGILNQRRKIIRCPDEELPEGYKLTQKKYKVWKLLDPNNRAARRSRTIELDEILAMFTGPDVVISINEIANAFGRTPSGLGVTMNALCKNRKLVKCGDAPARYRLANVTLAAILEEIDKSFSVKTMVEQPDENWFPILNRLESLIGGDAGAVLAEIQAYLKRRMNDD
jgi:hypothetical protein